VPRVRLFGPGNCAISITISDGAPFKPVVGLSGVVRPLRNPPPYFLYQGMASAMPPARRLPKPTLSSL